jgi:C4-dicarboxylate-specific signal transduction histidine kinase
VSSLLSTIFTLGSLTVDYRLGVKKMDQRIRNIEITTLGSLKGALWDLNLKIIQVQLNDLSQVEGIRSVQLFDEANNSLFNKENQYQKNNTFLFKGFEKLYPLHFEIDGQKIYGGKLVIQFSREHIYKDVVRRALITFVSQAAKTFFVSFILVLLYEKLITNDLVKMSHVLKNLNLTSTKSKELFPNKRETSDEISILQNQLEALSRRLAQINKENQDLLEIANAEKLMQESKALNAARLASLGEMAAGIAHEINNPLTIVKGNIHALSKRLHSGVDFDKDYYLNSFSKIDMAIERITKIIRNMKKISRDTSQEELNDIDLEELVKDTLDYYQEKFRKNDVRFEVSYKSTSRVHVREVELCQVLINILNNANDAVTDCSDKWIKVEVADEGEFASISVSDSGEGISKDNEEKIFNPFYTTKEVGKGTGLGLSISKDAMEQMKGDLILDSSNTYTQFKLLLKKS